MGWKKLGKVGEGFKEGIRRLIENDGRGLVFEGIEWCDGRFFLRKERLKGERLMWKW